MLFSESLCMTAKKMSCINNLTSWSILNVWCLISSKSFLKEQPREMNIHCKKRLTSFRPHTGCHYPNSPWTGKIKLFPARESLVSHIPAGDGKMANLF
jgi:hypothetical protein